MASCKLAALDDFASIPETQIAYIAGLIDADGTVTLNAAGKRTDGRRSYPLAMVLVVNGNLGLIRWLRETIGAGCAYETKTAPRRPDQNAAHWNKVHRFQLTGRRAKRLLERCRPYLRVKGAQADIVMRLPSRGDGFAVRASDEQFADAIESMRKIRILNQRGKKEEFQYQLVA